MCKGGCLGKCGCNMTSTTKGEKGDSSSSALLGYKVYRALITQETTGDPTARILENNLGGVITWTRTSTGVYRGTLTGVLVLSKTHYSVTPNDNSADTSFLISLFSGAPNYISLETRSSGTLTDGMLYESPIEILLYP